MKLIAYLKKTVEGTKVNHKHKSVCKAPEIETIRQTRHLSLSLSQKLF